MTKKQETKKQATRDGFGKALLELGENKKVVALSADLGHSLAMTEFIKKFPDQFVQTGIAEQNMAGVAAGLALEGLIPFMGSFASFQPMRNLDQIRTSICMMNANVKIISSHAGFSYGGDGIQIQALEDIAIMRALPNMQVFVPADAQQAYELTLEMAKHDGPQYLRLGRAPTIALQDHPAVDPDFFSPARPAQAQLLRGGTDAVIFACGQMVFTALDAALDLAADGIHAQVVNLHTVKPLDTATLLESISICKRFVTVEEHQLAGGMGSAVLEEISDKGLTFSHRAVAVRDQFGETARSNQELYDSRGLSKQNIINSVKTLMG